MAVKDITSLLSDVKNYLDITWDDYETERKLRGIIRRGISYLDEKAGKNLEYLEGSKEKGLLLDYARYARESALDEFEHDYLHELLALQIGQQLKGGADDEQGTTNL